jgi:hypothetical protein
LERDDGAGIETPAGLRPMLGPQGQAADILSGKKRPPAVMLEKIFEVSYIVGYWLYLGFAAYMLWPSDGIFTWISHVLVHAMVGIVWPMGLLLWYVGYFH